MPRAWPGARRVSRGPVFAFRHDTPGASAILPLITQHRFNGGAPRQYTRLYPRLPPLAQGDGYGEPGTSTRPDARQLVGHARVPARRGGRVGSRPRRRPPAAPAGGRAATSHHIEPQAAQTCEYPDDYTPTLPDATPAAHALSPDLIRLRSSGISSDDGDMLAANEALLSAVGVAPAPDAGQAVAMVSFTVKITTPGDWQPARSLMVIAYRWTNDTLTPKPICPDQDHSVLAAMGATGHPPLPPRIEPGQTGDGWVAFKIPRDSSALTLLMLRRGHNGYIANASALLKK